MLAKGLVCVRGLSNEYIGMRKCDWLSVHSRIAGRGPASCAIELWLAFYTHVLGARAFPVSPLMMTAENASDGKSEEASRSSANQSKVKPA